MTNGYRPTTETYHRLRQAGSLAIAHAPRLEAHPLGAPTSWDRVAGMLLGIAIGDALGNRSESLWPVALRHARQRHHRHNRRRCRRRAAWGRCAADALEGWAQRANDA